jgi:hypothetical protein
MPIDLSSYTKPIKTALKRGGFACVYVAAVDTPPRCRVGYSEDDLSATVGRLQRSSAAALAIESVLWVPNRSIATNIAKAVQCDLVACKANGGWLTCPPETAARAIELAAFRIYPGAAVVWHDQLLTQFFKAKAH